MQCSNTFRKKRVWKWFMRFKVWDLRVGPPESEQISDLTPVYFLFCHESDQNLKTYGGLWLRTVRCIFHSELSLFMFDVSQTAIMNRLCWGSVPPLIRLHAHFFQLSAHVNLSYLSLYFSISVSPKASFRKQEWGEENFMNSHLKRRSTSKSTSCIYLLQNWKRRLHETVLVCMVCMY